MRKDVFYQAYFCRENVIGDNLPFLTVEGGVIFGEDALCIRTFPTNRDVEF